VCVWDKPDGAGRRGQVSAPYTLHCIFENKIEEKEVYEIIKKVKLSLCLTN
jgi:hypothetical protein